MKNLAVDQSGRENFKNVLGFGKSKRQNSLDSVTLQKGIILMVNY